jgi:hypothetical protein
MPTGSGDLPASEAAWAKYPADAQSQRPRLLQPANLQAHFLRRTQMLARLEFSLDGIARLEASKIFQAP